MWNSILFEQHYCTTESEKGHYLDLILYNDSTIKGTIFLGILTGWQIVLGWLVGLITVSIGKEGVVKVVKVQVQRYEHTLCLKQSGSRDISVRTILSKHPHTKQVRHVQCVFVWLLGGLVLSPSGWTFIIKNIWNKWKWRAIYNTIF